MDYMKRKLSLPWLKRTFDPNCAQYNWRNNNSFSFSYLPEENNDEGSGGGDLVWVCEEFIANQNSQEISIQKGQQVEIVEAGSDWCLVRSLLPPDGGGGGDRACVEGLVPTSCLKTQFSVNMRTSLSKLSVDNEAQGDYSGILNDTAASSSSNSNTSPANKRRSTFRKWLTNPVRKLSHGRLDKTALDTTKANAKKNNASAKNKHLIGNEEMGNKSSSPSPPQPEDQVETKIKASKMRSQSLDLNGEEDDGAEMLELPPPMQIQERTFPQVCSQEDTPLKRSSSLSLKPRTLPSDLVSEIEQLVKQRMRERKADQSVADNQLQEAGPSESGGITPNENNTQTNNELQEIDEDVMASAIRKRQYVTQELCESETDYVRDLGTIVEGYMELMEDKDGEIPMPEALRGGKDKIVLGNLEQIYEWHRDTFHLELQKCLDEPVRLGILFHKYERKLQVMYERYCQNKPKSEFIVSEFDKYFEELRQKLGHKLQLSDLLIKPVQRIVKYQLLLKDIYKFTERAGLNDELDTLNKAIHTMHIVPKAADNMMNVGRLQGFDGKITGQGKLLLQNMFVVSESASGSNFKGKEWQVFFFEQIIIFSEVVGKRTQFSNPVYIYKKHVQLNKMALEEHTDDDDPYKFVLISKCPQQQGIAFTIQAPTVEVRNEWVATLRAILDTQMDFLKAIQCPIAYQKELTKETSEPELSSMWNPTLRKTLSHPSAATAFFQKHGGDSGDKQQRRTQRDKKVKASSDASDRRMTVACAPVPVTTKQDSASANKMTSLPCSPTDRFSEHEPNEPLGPLVLKQVSEQRKHSLPVTSLVAGTSVHSSSQSPPKSKKNFLEGFRNTLRPKSKTELSLNNGLTTANEPITDAKNGDAGRRWSETNTVKQLRPESSGDISDTVVQ